MGVRQESKRDVAEKMHERYLKASRKEKGRLLEEFVELTGYHPKHAQVLLRHGPPRPDEDEAAAGRPVAYGPPVVVALMVDHRPPCRGGDELDLRQAAGGGTADNG